MPYQDLTFYSNPRSRGRIARWMLEETGAEYQTEIIEYGMPMKKRAYRNINPMGKVPAITHGDVAVSEVSAICTYLADAFPVANLAPATDQRGAYYRWLFYAAGPLEHAISNNNLDYDIPTEKQGTLGYGSFKLVMDVLEKQVAKGYIAEGRFTAADLYVGSHIGFGLQFGTIEKRTAFEDYWALVSDRDAYRRANELDNALLEG